MTKTSKKKSKHPMKMTTDEALNHLFHPKVAKALRNHVKEQKPKPLKKD